MAEVKNNIKPTAGETTETIKFNGRDIPMINGAKGTKHKRCLLTTYVNVADKDAEEKEWQVLGHGIEEASYETDVEKETTTDILCETTTDVTNVVETISFDPYHLVAGDKLQSILSDIFIRGNHQEYSNFEVLTVHGYVGEKGKHRAVTHDACTITIDGFGGSTFLEMPITIDMGGTRTVGTVDTYYNLDKEKSPTFTKEEVA